MKSMTYLYRGLSVMLLVCLLAACGDDKVPPKPKTETQTKTVDVGKPFCQQLTVPVKAQERKGYWSYDSSAKAWVKTWSPWEPSDQKTRPATAKDCVKLVPAVPKNAALPDLVMKRLDKCGKGDLTASGGDCFFIVNPGPYDKDFPKLEGKKLLFFPIITLNIGQGASELIADRTAKDAEDWRAYQTFYNAKGKRLGSMFQPSVEFYFAGDGHEHWHVRDFDDYYLLDSSGEQVRMTEKHGYCMQDNTTYTPMRGEPGVPPEPGVYLDETSCGKGLPQALTIIHGLSKGWGDTYPSNLPDQCIDITGLPDGDYTVFVQADTRAAVTESNEHNNSTSMKITIKGDEVTTHPETAKGGID
jgi:hypothetical protein